MVEINNQRKCGSLICWRGRRELDNGRRRKPEIKWLWRHCRRRAIYWLLRSPRKLVTLNPKPKSRRQSPASFPVGGIPTASKPFRKTSPKSQDAVALQQIKERGALPMIDRGDIRQAPTVAAISGLHCRALVMVSSSIRLTAWLQNSKKRAERSERLMYEQSHRDYLRSAICIIVCLSWAG